MSARVLATVALLCLAPLSAASAHQIWLERDADGIRIYFGEFDENLREASPGLLDRLNPQARSAAAEGPLKVSKTGGFFAVAGTVGADDSVLAEDARIVERRGEKGARILTRLGARHVPDFKERAPANTLDIVPAGKPGAFKVFYQGKPLARAKLEVIAESGWKREVKTDEQGAAETALPWRGAYVVEVEHSDATAGRLGEQDYDSVRSASTLSFRLNDGPQGAPVPPPVTPKR